MKTVRFVRLALLAGSLILVQRTANAQVVTTLAGSGAAGSADGNGAAASFSHPPGLSVGPSGNVYVADTSLKIRKITPDGVVTTLAGNGSPGYEDGIGSQARFFGPLGVAADASGNVWVADSDDGEDGQYVKKISAGGVVSNLSLYPGVDPIAVAVDDAGILYVLDRGVGLWKISTDLKSSQLATRDQVGLVGEPSSGPWGLAVDGASNVYLAGDDKIQKIAPDGSVTTLAGSGSPGSADGLGASASFRNPTGVAVDASGNVYVADRGNNTIRKITSSGNVTTLAGSATPGSADRTGTAASFNSPSGVALDASGNLYVTDSGNNKIRKITFPGGGQPCVSDQTTLCLGGGRFKVTTQWATSGDRNGAGLALAPAGGDSGYFTFFDPGSVEVAVKVVNGCSAGGSFWIFAAGLTDVGVVMTVTDTQTGKAKSYANAQGTPFQPIQDTSTFATCAAGATADAFGRSLDPSLLPSTVTETFDAGATGPCVANATTLCLSNSRYQVRTQWFTQDGGSGDGQAINLTADTGAFWFFSPSDVEVVTKVLNGCGLNARYWAFAGGLTDVNVILTVTDTQTGTIRTYTNPQGTPFEPIQDTNAFDTCP